MPLVRTSKKHPCVICGHTHWCSFSADETTVVCMWTEAGRAGQTRDGLGSVFHLCAICHQWGACGTGKDGDIAFCLNVTSNRQAKTGSYIHPLNGEIPRPVPKPKNVTVALPVQHQIAPIEHRHAIYTAFLESLTLERRHGDNLEERGLGDIEIARQLYATTPDTRTAQRLTDDLAGRFDLGGVPGFFRQGGRWRGVDLRAGILIPIRNENFLIQALQIRCDEGEPRYPWWSSRGFPGGVSSGAPVHFAKPWRVEMTRKLIVTEGGLKAQVIAEFDEYVNDCVMGLPGVASFQESIGIQLRQLFPTLKSCAIAFDSDWSEKREVKRALFRLIDALEASALTVTVMNWVHEGDSPGPKGFDDYLLELRYEAYNTGT